MKDPVAIIRSWSHPDRLVAMYEFELNGKNVVAAFEVDGVGVMHNDNIDSNSLTTVFGKTNSLYKLSEAIKNEAAGKKDVFFWDKKRWSSQPEY